MKLVYIKHDTLVECFRLEIGKTYEIMRVHNTNYFQIQIDEGTMIYNKKCFITLGQYRENKINKILND